MVPVALHDQFWTLSGVIAPVLIVPTSLVINRHHIAGLHQIGRLGVLASGTVAIRAVISLLRHQDCGSPRFTLFLLSGAARMSIDQVRAMEATRRRAADDVERGMP